MRTRIHLVVMLLVTALAAGADAPRYVWTDRPLTIELPGATSYELEAITHDGVQPLQRGEIVAGKLAMEGLSEGIHILTTDNDLEHRFLAMAPPVALDTEALRRHLPRNAQRLLDGEPFRILSMGDSVTATGDYEVMLKMLLERATGNTQIEVIDRSYPGRSIDASIRNFQKDAVETQPHMAMIMYGLNDQGAGCSLHGYIEQHEWLVERLRKLGADPLILQPTPDISLGKEQSEYGPSMFRVIGYGGRLWGNVFTMEVPVVDTFNAIWGKGESLQAIGENMRVYFPHHYSKPFTSMATTDGKGDGIHPNALGHLAMAKAVYAELIWQGTSPFNRLTQTMFLKSGSGKWDEKSLLAEVKLLRNGAGRLEIYPLPGFTIEVDGELEYEDWATFTVRWPEITSGEDLLEYPANLYNFSRYASFVVVDYREAGSSVHLIRQWMPRSDAYLPQRIIVTAREFSARAAHGENEMPLTLTLPDQPVGRIPLIAKHPSRPGWSASELAYVQFGAAREGGATIDGDLSEWEGHHWIPVGEPVQARWTRGPEDHRESVDECYTEWTFKAGEEGIAIAVKARGALEGDSATIFFDPRPPDELGTPGPYYWLSVGRNKNGNLQLRPGETSDRQQPGLTGVWQPTDDGAIIEIFVPYTLMKTEAWPAAGDLGLSIDWRHTSPDDGAITHLQWSEDGHPWNPRWYGVVRLTDDHDNLPYRVRIK